MTCIEIIAFEPGHSQFELCRRHVDLGNTARQRLPWTGSSTNRCRTTKCRSSSSPCRREYPESYVAPGNAGSKKPRLVENNSAACRRPGCRCHCGRQCSILPTPTPTSRWKYAGSFQVNRKGNATHRCRRRAPDRPPVPDSRTGMHRSPWSLRRFHSAQLRPTAVTPQTVAVNSPVIGTAVAARAGADQQAGGE